MHMSSDSQQKDFIIYSELSLPRS